MKINIIGAGNLATQFVKNLENKNEINILQWYSRSFKKSKNNNGVIKINKLEDLKSADINLLMVSDNMIKKVSEKIKNKSLTVHSSGILNIKELKNNGRKGVFYPIQTFTKEKNVDFKNIPICVESENKSDYLILKNLAKALNSKPISMKSNKRKHLHLVATIVNNFTNHLYVQAEEICIDKKIPFSLFENIIKETSSKAINYSPKKIQTGPAKRNDKITIEKHLELLEKKSFKKIYKTITESIVKYYEK